VDNRYFIEDMEELGDTELWVERDLLGFRVTKNYVNVYRERGDEMGEIARFSRELLGDVEILRGISGIVGDIEICFG
jgi:hypothetical protein